MCYCIDKAEGVRRREEVFVAFEYGAQPQAQSQAQRPFIAGRNAAAGAGTILPVHHNRGQRGKDPGPQPQPQLPKPGPGQVQGPPETIIPRSPLSTRRNDGTESMFGVGHGIGRAAGMGGREDTESELGSEEEQEEEVPVQSRPKAKQKKSVPISPYRVGSDSEDDDDNGRTPTMTTNISGNAMRPPQQPHAPSGVSKLRPPVEEDEEDLDPFKTTGVNVDEEALLEGLGGGGYTSTSPRSIAGVGYPATSTSPPGRGVHAPGLGLAQGFNLHGHRRSTSGGLGGLDFGVGVAPTAPAATGGVSGFATAGGALAAAHRERMMSSTQELNMKSQFLMNMRGSGAGGSGYGADSGVSEATGGGTESEGEESQLGPGSDFFK